MTQSAEYVAPRLTVGSLFSGIGGIDLGLERAGMKVVWQSEIDPYASKVLAKHWPTVPNLGDVTKVDWDGIERPDIVAGGFPCQPVSGAGAQRAQADSRWLWPEVARCLRNLRPRFVILENVPALLTVVAGGAAQEVFGDLASLGYNAEWDCLPAAIFGARHLRHRVFVVAYASGEGLEVSGLEPAGLERQAAERGGPGRGGTALADTDSPPRYGPGSAGQAVFGPGTFERPGRCSCCDGDHWAVEPDVGRVAHGVPSRVDRLRCIGNAVVPQVAEYVGRRLVTHIDGSVVSSGEGGH